MTQPPTSSEAADLMGYLTKQREHVLGILENLPEEAMRRPVLPTGWTCAGGVALRHIVRHGGAGPRYGEGGRESDTI